MTNRERIDAANLAIREMCRKVRAGEDGPEGLVHAAQTGAADFLFVIANILDEMNEREKARENVTEQGVAERMTRIFMDTPIEPAKPVSSVCEALESIDSGEDDAT